MDAFDAEPIVAELLANPEAEHALAALHRVGQSSPADGAAVLERLAASVAEAQPLRASRWLTEAAALWSVSAGDPKRASRALRAAIELAPGDDEALARLVQLYRDNGKHGALARILERRAETMAEQAGRDPAAQRRAAEAFTMLGHLLRDPPLDSAATAIAAYRRAIGTGAAPAETYHAARALHLRDGQIADALPLFAMERARTTDPAQALALYREEASVRQRGGDGPGATEALRRARALAPDAAGVAEEIARSIVARMEAGPVAAGEPGEAAEIFAALAEASGQEETWRAAERCFVAAERWEDASWAAERRGDYAQALDLLGRPQGLSPEARLRVALRELRLCAVGLGDARRTAARAEALLDELPPACDAATLERLARADRGGNGSAADVAAKLEAAALRRHHVHGLKVAFELAAHVLEGALRATELVRQAEVLAGVGAERPLALRHAEAGLEGLAADEAAPLLERLSNLAAPDEAIDLYQRQIGRCEAPDDRAAAIEVAARVAQRRGSAERMARFFEAVAVHCIDEPSLAALERAAIDGDRKRGGTVLRGLFAAALAKAEPAVLDGGRTRSAFLRRAARVARRDLGDPDQAFEWLGDALFARLEGALEDALAPLEGQSEELRRVEAAARELRAVLERSSGVRAVDPPASRPPTTPPPPRPFVETPASRSPTTPPPPRAIVEAPAPRPPSTPLPPRAVADTPAPRPPAILPSATPLPPRAIAEAPAPRPPSTSPPSPPPSTPLPPRAVVEAPAPRPPSQPAAPSPPSTPLPPRAGLEPTLPSRPLAALLAPLATPPPVTPLPPRPAVEAPASRPPTIPPPAPRVASKPATVPPPAPAAVLRPTRPPPTPPVPHFEVRVPSPPRQPSAAPLELRDPFPAAAPAALMATAPDPPFLPGPKRRLSGEELLADLFESMHAIDFCKDALEASAFTVTLAMDQLQSAVGIAHLYDIDRREFVVVFARGPGAAAVRGMRTSDADPLAAEAMRTHGALVLREGAGDARASGKRWDMLRAVVEPPVAEIACARAALAGRFLGMIELCHVEGAGGFAEGDEHALAYIAERFTEFVAAHGVVLGEEG